MMQWRDLLSTRRLGEQSAEALTPGRSPFHKDYDRIVFSSAFRRLQDKTQVHSQPESDYVRTRLTHSLEVASVGRSLGNMIGDHVTKTHALADGIGAAEFGHIVSAACLAHDIGNPPFGHFGEAVIRDWFRRDLVGRDLIAPLSAAQRADLEGFEGNAQGFRVLARLQNWQDAGGLRLTAATLGAFTKYPRAARLADPAATRGDSGGRKFGFFEADAELFREVAEELGLDRRGAEGDLYWARHPLAYLVEAADDICYLVVDLEDGYKLGRITFAEAEELLVALADLPLPKRSSGFAQAGDDRARYGEVGAEPRKIAYLRAKAIGQLVGHAAETFIANHDGILDGGFRSDLLSRTPADPVLRRIAALTEARVFEMRSRHDQELTAAEALSALMTAYSEAVQEHEDALNGGAEPSARARLLIRHLDGVEPLLDDRYQWLLKVTDYVTGMTDSYALSQYRRLIGLGGG